MKIITRRNSYVLLGILFILMFFSLRVSEGIGMIMEPFSIPTPMQSYAIQSDYELPENATTVVNEDDYYKTTDSKENVYLLNKLNKEQELIKQISQSDKNFNLSNAEIFGGKAQGWWADAINCEQNASNFYCKNKDLWVWPY